MLLGAPRDKGEVLLPQLRCLLRPCSFHAGALHGAGMPRDAEALHMVLHGAGLLLGAVHCCEGGRVRYLLLYGILILSVYYILLCGILILNV